MPELIIKDHDYILFKIDLTGKQAADIMNTLEMKDKTIQPCEKKELDTFRAGTNPGD